MLKIRLIVLGRMKGDFAYLQAGVEDYLKRLRPYADVALEELPDERVTPSRTRDWVLAREAERLTPWMERSGYVIVLSERGQLHSSEQFAAELDRRGLLGGNPINGGIPLSGDRPIIVIVGSALGFVQASSNARTGYSPCRP